MEDNGKELSTNMHGSPVIRRIRRDGWTKAARAVFLDHLAATCNVRASAQAAGRGYHSVYGLRRRDPDFAAAWEAAIETGYARLEAMMLARASGTGGTAAIDNAIDPETLPEPPDIDRMDSEMGMRLLALHRKRGPNDRGRKPFRRVSQSEVEQALLKRLKALHNRMVKEGRSNAGLGFDHQ